MAIWISYEQGVINMDNITHIEVGTVGLQVFVVGRQTPIVVKNEHEKALRDGMAANKVPMPPLVKTGKARADGISGS